jgi:hypothetical protein
VIDTAVSTVAKGAAEQVKDAAEQVWEDIQQRITPPKAKKRRRSWLWIAVTLIGLAGLAYFASRRFREGTEDSYGPAPDAFGEAVLEERALFEEGRAPVPTPGA